MPGEWVDIAKKAADSEEVQFAVTGLTPATEYEFEFSENSSFPEDGTASGSVTTLPTALLDRGLEFVLVNGISLASEWEWEENNSHTHEVNIDALTGSILVTAGTSNPLGTVAITPNDGVVDNVTQGSTTTFIITVTVQGGTRSWTLTCNVEAPPTVIEKTAPFGNLNVIHDMYCTSSRLWLRRNLDMRAYDLFSPTLAEVTAERFAFSNRGSNTGVTTHGGMTKVGSEWFVARPGADPTQVLVFGEDGVRKRVMALTSDQGAQSFATCVNRNDELWVLATINNTADRISAQRYLPSTGAAIGNPIVFPPLTGDSYAVAGWPADAVGDNWLLATSSGQAIVVSPDGQTVRIGTAPTALSSASRMAHVPGTSSAFYSTGSTVGDDVLTFSWAATGDHEHIASVQAPSQVLFPSPIPVTIFMSNTEASRLYVRYITDVQAVYREIDPVLISPNQLLYRVSVPAFYRDSEVTIEVDTDPDYGNPLTVLTALLDQPVIVPPPPPPPVVTPPTTDPGGDDDEDEEEALPPPTPTGLAGNSSADEVALSWDAVGEADSYAIRYRESGERWQTVSNIRRASATVENLDSSTEYQFQVRATNSDGDSDWSGTVSVTTKSSGTGPVDPPTVTVDAPPTPGGFTLEASGENAIVASWSAAARADGYRFQWRPEGGSWRTVTTSGTSRTITGLTAGATYQARVRAYNDGGNSSYSATRSATTDESTGPPPDPDVVTVPSTPRGLAGNASATAVALAWNGVIGASRYDVRYRTGTGA